VRAFLSVLLVCLALTSCSDGDAPDAAPAPSGSASGSASAASSAAPNIVLPPGPLQELVPESADLPPGMVAILSGSGPRDVKAIAAYSADATKAQGLLVQHGFRNAYVGQYADPATGRVLSVVVSRFATAAGATADLAGDLTASTGELIQAATVGEQSQVRKQPLPSAKPPGQLVTVRFRKGVTTWLVAYGSAPQADPDVALKVARTLAGRA